MTIKYSTKGTKKEIEQLQTIESKTQNVPSPPSLLINGSYVNVCPKCKKPCSNFPWTCSHCNWTAATEPELCACKAIHAIIENEDGSYCYPMPDDDEISNSSKLNEYEKLYWDNELFLVNMLELDELEKK